jgi:transcriptional regulator with XRE-family HTH domain
MKINEDNGGMDESISKRIAALREKLKLNKAQFAERIGITGQFVSMVESGKSKFTEANIRLICFTFKVNEEWLREGKGEMMNAEALLCEKEGRLLELFRRLSPGAQKAFIEYIERLVSLAANETLLEELPNTPKQAPGGTTRRLEAPPDTEGGGSPGIGPNPKNGETG